MIKMRRKPNNHEDQVDSLLQDMGDQDSFEQFDREWDEIQRERKLKIKAAMDNKRQKFIKLVERNKDWKIRKTLTASDILILARVLCRSVSIDAALQPQGRTIYSCPEEREAARHILDELLLTFRRSSSHLKDRVTHPDYRDEQWHGTGADILMKIEKTCTISDCQIDADKLYSDYCYETIGPEQYRKNLMKAVDELLEENDK